MKGAFEFDSTSGFHKAMRVSDELLFYYCHISISHFSYSMLHSVITLHPMTIPSHDNIEGKKKQNKKNSWFSATAEKHLVFFEENQLISKIKDHSIIKNFNLHSYSISNHINKVWFYKMNTTFKFKTKLIIIYWNYIRC